MSTIIYSSALHRFLANCQKRALKILRNEVHLKTGRSRFTYGRYAYPLTIVAIEDAKKLGYYCPNFREIGINKVYLFTHDYDTLDNLLRHELAHMLVHLKYGAVAEPHGTEYRAMCKAHGWGAEVSSATMDLSQCDLTVGSFQNARRLLSKIQKLLALAESANAYEAESAALKANELLLKAGIEESVCTGDDEMVALRTLESKRTSPKMQAIAEILRSFLVHPIINRGTESVYLELFGTRTAVTVAEYVAHFLDREIERLWKAERRQFSGGVASRNSFIRGLARGFIEKAQRQRDEEGLVVVEKTLSEALPLAYPHLRTSVSRYKRDSKAEKLGKVKGAALKIRKGVEQKRGKILRLFFK